MHYLPMINSMRDTIGMTHTEAKIQALSWLRSQLRWERTLDARRGDEDEPAARAA